MGLRRFRQRPSRRLRLQRRLPHGLPAQDQQGHFRLLVDAVVHGTAQRSHGDQLQERPQPGARRHTWLKTLAVAFLVGNPDDYRNDANNYYIYFYEGVAVYIPYDNDQCLGFGWNPFGDQDWNLSYTVNLDIYYNRTAQSWISYDDLVLVKNVFRYSDYQAIYEDYLDEFTDSEDGIFDYDAFLSEYLTARSLYRSELLEEDHLGATTFSLTERWMEAEDYYAQKAAYVRERVEYHRTH
ncbi:MAG: hypothetical protein WC509_03060 [Candidatus Izemoplasmatales bacterium]